MEAQLTGKRHFVANDLNINQWEDIEPYFKTLQNEKINSLDELKTWLKKKSELDSVLSENMAWRYIKMSMDTNDKEKAEAFQFFIREIQPKLAPLDHQLNQKLLSVPFLDELTKEKAYQIYIREVRKSVEIFRQENVKIESELEEQAQQYGQISGNQSIEVDGADVTMQKAAIELKSTDRNYRKSVYDKMVNRRLDDADKLDDLFDDLIKKRHQIALNAGYENYRDYMFAAMGRFDYTPDDCLEFHDAIEDCIVPLLNQMQEKRKGKLGVDSLNPYDMSVDPDGAKPLKPFEKAQELLDGTQKIFHELDPYFGECLDTMEKINHLDLESKKGKSPGGFNYPLFESGAPFIFMNAVGAHRDLITMIHEGGHAIHSFLTKDLEHIAFQSCPSEIAELASMSMEMFTLELWKEFYDSAELKRAQQEQLETVLIVLPWVATIDRFQHWIYTNPKHSREERKEKWVELYKKFNGNVVDWSGYEQALENSWQKQLHLYEVPFYYIEYGMAQLGALSLWKNFKEDPSATLKKYKEALSLGYTKTIPEVYEAAGISFDFSIDNIQSLATFIGEAQKKLDNEK